MASFSDLSQEVVDYILDYLHDDLPSLRRCAVTCRSWTGTSQFHLFHSIAVRGSHQSDLLLGTLSTSTRLARYITRLEIGGCGGDIGHSDLHPPHGVCWLNSPAAGLRVLVPALPSVAHLTISSFIWDHLEPDSLRCLLHHFRALKTVFFSRCRFNTFSVAMDAFRLCPPLDSLSLGGNMVGPNSPCPPPDPSKPRNALRELKMLNADASSSTILDAFDLHVLESFYICTDDVATLTWLRAVCFGAGPSLRNLDLRITSKPTDVWKTTLDLKCAINVRSLSIRLLSFSSSTAWLMFWLAGFLETIPSTSLNKVTYCIADITVTEAEALDWNRIRRAIERKPSITVATMRIATRSSLLLQISEVFERRVGDMSVLKLEHHW